MRKNMLRLARIDEACQFNVLRCAFCPAFCLLKDSLFNHITSDNPSTSNGSTASNLAAKLKVPLLSMAVALNIRLLSLVSLSRDASMEWKRWDAKVRCKN